MAKTYRDIPQLTPQQIANFWNKVDKTPGHGPNGDCWIWKGGKARHGYGHFNLKKQKRQCQAHRVAYFLTYKNFNPSLCVCHSCDNGYGGCVRPDHLWQGTIADNHRDMREKSREARGDKHGSKTHPESRPHGEQCSYAKITEEIVRTIRSDAARGVSHSELARRHGISRPMVILIVQHKRWAYVE